jgi:hypothetical protein
MLEGAGNQSTWPGDKSVRPPPAPAGLWRRLRRGQRVAVLALLGAICVVGYRGYWIYEQHRGVDPHIRMHELRSTIEEAGVHCAAWNERGHNRALIIPDYRVEGTCRLSDGLQLNIATFRENSDLDTPREVPCPRIEGDVVWIDLRDIHDRELLRRLDAAVEQNRWSYVTCC